MPGVDTYNKIISTVNSVTTDYQFIPDISNIITIDTSNNRIGIGTLNPETSLHIKGSNNLGIITTNLEISSNPYDLNSGFVKSSLIPDNFNYSNSTFTEPTNDNSKNQFTLGDPSNPWYTIYCISGNFDEINLDIVSINRNLNFISYNNTPSIISSQSDIIIDPSGIGDNSGKLTIKGDLIVLGNQTTLSSQELDISDNIITLNKGYDVTLNGINMTSGFYIDKGQSYTNASLLYYIDEDIWKLSGSGGLKIPDGSNNERSNNSDPGTIRYNRELTSFEGYNGTAWGTLGGVISVDKRTKIIPETSPTIGNNQLDFYTDNNHIMRLDESGNMLPMHINQNIGNNTKAWKNIYIGDPNGIDYNLNDNSSNAIYLNNIKILYFDNNKNLVFNNPNSNIKIPFNLSVDGTAGIASTANNNTNIAGGFVYNTKIGIDQNGINGLEQSYFSQTQTYELTVLDSINFHDSLTNNYNYSLKDANFNNLEISNNLIVNGDFTSKIESTNYNNSNIKQQVFKPFVPPGAVMSFATKAAPEGWLECNGNAVSRDTYSNLFDIIGTTWGSGDGSTTFDLPNLNGGYFVRGGNVDGQYNSDSTKKPRDFTIYADQGTTSHDGHHGHGFVYHDPNSGSAQGHAEVGGTLNEWPYPRGAFNNGTRRSLSGIDGGGGHEHTFNTQIHHNINDAWNSETAPINVRLLYCIKY
jgi:hypothetical protein